MSVRPRATTNDKEAQPRELPGQNGPVPRQGRSSEGKL